MTTTLQPQGTVLVVDDERDNLEVFQFNFDEEFSVVTASSAAEAIAILDGQLDVEVVVADQRMPTTLGLDLLDEVRRRWPLISRVLLTGHTSEELLLEALNRRVLHRFISKPWRYEDMFEVLKDSIARHRLEKQNASLERQLHQASHLTLMGELSATLIHDLYQPLQVIETGLVVAGEIVEGGSESIATEMDDLKGAIADAESAVIHLRKLAITMRRLMRQHPEQLQPISLTDVVPETLHVLRSRIQGQNIELKVSGLDRPAPIMADRVQLAQLILNIAHNAIDAMVDVSHRTLTIAIDEEPGHYALRISDSGPGIPAVLQQQVFEPFFTTKASGEGTGLGLAIVKRIVQAHGGQIDVRGNGPAPGSTFVIRLPIAEVECAPFASAA